VSDTTAWVKDYVPLFTALAAIAVALFQYVTGRRRSAADIGLVDAQTRKTQKEIEKISQEMARLSESYTTSSDNIAEIQSEIARLPRDEVIVYQSNENPGFDIHGHEGRIWDSGRPATEKATGVLSFLEHGIINVHRTNSDGKYEIYLHKYVMTGGKSSELIPKNSAGDKPRRFRVSCEARSLLGDHTVKIGMRDVGGGGTWYGQATYRISSQEWKRLEAYFSVPASAEACLRIDDQDVSTVPSTIQFRRLVVTRRKEE
jgi:hypothetical protein